MIRVAMKTNTVLLLVCSIAMVLVTGCEIFEIDNYDPPNVKLTGNVVYQGESLQLGTDEVTIQLWEEGWQLEGAIVVNVARDGSYAALLYKGTYNMVFESGQGPFMMTDDPSTGNDTIHIQLTGNMSKDIEVLPYYMVRNASISAGGGKVSATFGAEKIITGADEKDIDRAYLFLNKTTFVDRANNIESVNISGGSIADPNSISLEADIPELIPTQSYIFARVGIRIAGVEDYIYSETVKLNL